MFVVGRLGAEPRMSIASTSRRVARLLTQTGRKVVFAESCTGGLVSGALTRIAGISNYHCGGVVVYRNQTKTAYLGIPPALLARRGAVSREVAKEMARRVLAKTPEADLAAAVTGHLGPNAPARQDGLVFVAVAWRTPPRTIVRRLQCGKADSRVVRQRWVVEQVLTLVAEALEAAP
jgi:nicotinamide-nucleotide amidase